jgi:hypothetical protein
MNNGCSRNSSSLTIKVGDILTYGNKEHPYAFTERVQAMELYAELHSRMVYRRDSNGKPIIRNGSFDWFSVYDECDRAMAKVQPFRKDSKLGVIGAYNTGIREWTIEAKQKKAA